jgi:hypothetical protein
MSLHDSALSQPNGVCHCFRLVKYSPPSFVFHNRKQCPRGGQSRDMGPSRRTAWNWTDLHAIAKVFPVRSSGIHPNPRRTEPPLVLDPRDWRWSSYRGFECSPFLGPRQVVLPWHVAARRVVDATCFAGATLQASGQVRRKTRNSRILSPDDVAAASDVSPIDVSRLAGIVFK